MATAAYQSPGTSVATTPKDTILALIEQQAHDIASLAPRGFTPAHYAASLSLHLQKNPDLLKCSPASIAQGILRVAQTGLELGVSCDLLPFLGKNPTCQFNPRYNGLVELALGSGVRAINADVVRDDDTLFEFEKGTEFKLRHIRGPGNGKIIWAYAIAQVKIGSFVFEVLSREEIDQRRARYSKQWKNQSLDEIPWYGVKTAIRKLSALLPKNPRFAAALAFDADIREIEGDEVEEIPEGEYEIQSPSTPPVAAEPTQQREAATSTASVGEAQPAGELTLAEAKATKLIGQPGSWGGKAGQPLDSFSSGHLESIRKWCATKLEEKDDPPKQLMVDAITLILLDRDSAQTTMELTPETKAPAAAEPEEEEINFGRNVEAGIAANEARAKAAGL